MMEMEDLLHSSLTSGGIWDLNEYSMAKDYFFTPKNMSWVTRIY